jgi:Protein of unknown function (DUF3343)
VTAGPTQVLFVVPSAQAVRGEAALIGAGISCALIPVPRTLTSECGVCLRVGAEDRETAGKALNVAGIEVSATHDFEVVNRGEKGR